MKIAQISPLMESVPPRFYGGTERIVSYLTEELAALGHEVTLFASGDSRSTARLAACWPQALRLDPAMRDYLAPHYVMLETLAARAQEFDVIHSHIDYMAFPHLRHCGRPFVSTLHGRLDLPELRPLYQRFDDAPVVSISAAQRLPLPEARFVATVHHGLPPGLLAPGGGEGGYLAFLGRLSPEKAPDAAIRIAAAAGLPLRIAAKIDKSDEDYAAELQPLLKQPHVTFLGEIGEAEKQDFLGRAAALLFPIVWSEPFGLVMIEALACGTPVIAFPQGSVPEVIEDGVTGFLVADEREAVAAVRRLDLLDRRQIRRRFERRFTARRMAEDYLEVYRRLLSYDQPLRAVV